MEKEKKFWIFLIDKVIIAKNAEDLKDILDLVYNYNWIDKYRKIYLLGLLQGAVMQYNKKASIDELETIFKTY